jgi:hypothetical protein
MLFVTLYAWPVEAQPSDDEWHERGSTVAFNPLASGYAGMSVGGGFAVALPFQAFEIGTGLGGDADLKARYQVILGVLHQIELHLRWAPLEVGVWRIGAQLGVGYDFFGLQSDALNLTSTFFLSVGLGATARTSEVSNLILGLGLEIDLFEFRVLDGEDSTQSSVRIDATRVLFGWKTRLADELDAYVLGTIRIPTDTFVFEGEPFSAVPFVEFGGAWAW